MPRVGGIVTEVFVSEQCFANEQFSSENVMNNCKRRWTCCLSSVEVAEEKISKSNLKKIASQTLSTHTRHTQTQTQTQKNHQSRSCSTHNCAFTQWSVSAQIFITIGRCQTLHMVFQEGKKTEIQLPLWRSACSCSTKNSCYPKLWWSHHCKLIYISGGMWQELIVR